MLYNFLYAFWPTLVRNENENFLCFFDSDEIFMLTIMILNESINDKLSLNVFLQLVAMSYTSMYAVLLDIVLQMEGVICEF